MFTAILLNGGIGARVKSDMPKQLIRIKEIPIFIYSLRVFDNLDEISEIIINYPDGWKKSIKVLIDKYAIRKKILFSDAGNSRQESVRKMLNKVKTENVIIHESARPLVDESDLKRLIGDVSDNVTMTLPIPFTVLRKNTETNFVSGNLIRSELVNILLPQKFSSTTLRECHYKAFQDGKAFTEDASLLYEYGYKVKCLEGREECFKVTTKQDILFAEQLLSKKRERF